jgi:hypothetical protein
MKKTVIVLEFSKCIADEKTIPVVPKNFALNSNLSADITGNKFSWQYLSVRIRI